MSNNMKKVYLVDGSSIFFRSYHAIPALHRADGTPTNALYGYLTSLHSLFHEYDIAEMAVAFDRPEALKREKVYAKYKANRKETPDDLAVQIPFIKQATQLLGISFFEESGVEADDLIGTMAAWLRNQEKEVVIVSSDKDLLQLVDESVCVLRPTPKGYQFYKSKEVEERYGVTPKQFIDVLALMGDTSDNVPGVPGIGEKTAVSLIQEFGSLENLYDKLDQVKGKKRKENLFNNKEQAFLSRQLVTIDIHVPIDLRLDHFHRRDPNQADLRSFYMEMEFRRFVNAINETVQKEEGQDYATIGSLDQLQTVIDTIKRKGACAVDTETTSLDVFSANLVGLSLTVEERQGWYIPLGHVDGPNLPWEETRALLKEILEDESITKVGHNLKFDYHILRQAGITLRGQLDDTLLMSYLLHPDRQNHKLDDLAFSILHFPLTPISDLIGQRGKDQKTMDTIPIEQAAPYACEDTDATWRLNHLFLSELENEPLFPLYETIDRPLMPILAGMEHRGIRVDPDILAEQSQAIEKELMDIQRAVYESVGKEFNLNSPSQIAEILYDDLKILTGRKRSTRAELLTKLADDGIEIAQQILDYRHRQKIKSTYLDSLRKLIRPETGRVHTTFHQTVTNTGRISSSDPNLQNIPTRTDLGRRVRRAFVAEEGYRLLSLDYSQIELRILAHVAEDPGLIKAFLQGEDIHSSTAAKVFGVPLDDVTSDMRRKAKEINFGLNYGMSPYGLAKRLGITDSEASQYIETYFTQYPNVQLFMDSVVSFAKENFHVHTVYKRKIPTPGIRDNNRMRQENAKRAAINAPIQGSAADMLKAAMVQVNKVLDPNIA
ncbi:DNA polymerase I, partial [bacterium]|nr:DNA polymerase I [bacterium]